MSTLTQYTDWMYNPSKEVIVIYDKNNQEVIVSSIYDELTGKTIYRSREMRDVLEKVVDLKKAGGDISVLLPEIEKLLKEIKPK